MVESPYPGKIVENVMKVGPFATFSEKFDLYQKPATPRVTGLSSPDPTKSLYKNLKNPLVFFDLETTGKSITSDQIIQGYFEKYIPGKAEPEVFKFDIKPTIAQMSEKAAEITGITQKELIARTKTFKDILPQLETFLKDADLAGYNIVNYDIPLLQEELKRAGSAVNLLQKQAVDVLSLTSQRYPEGSTELTAKTRKLEDVYEALKGTRLLNAHEAGADVKATREILEQMVATSSMPASVAELRKLSDMPPPTKPGGTLMDFFKADKLSALEGSLAIKGKEIDVLFEKLLKEKAVVKEAQPIFQALRQQGAELFFNPKTRSLYFAESLEQVKMGGTLQALPLFKDMGTRTGKMVQVGKRAAGTLSALLVGDAGTVLEKNFLQLFYDTMAEQSTSYLSQTARSAKKAMTRKIPNIGEIRSLLLNDFTIRGMDTSLAQSSFQSEKFVVGFASEKYVEDNLYQALQKYRVSNTAISMLTKTGGRTIYTKLGLEEGATVKNAFETIQYLKDKYLGSEGELVKFLKSTGQLATAPYIKGDYLGNKRLMVGGRMLGNMYGTRFEEHTVAKGLYQLAKVADTTNAQFRRLLSAGEYPFAPYVTASEKYVGPDGREGIGAKYRRGQLVPVAVVETDTMATSLRYFGESGSYYTERAVPGLQKRFSRGTLTIGKISSTTTSGKIKSPKLTGGVIAAPSADVVDMIKDLFGVDFANKGYTQFFNEAELKVDYTLNEFERALKKRVRDIGGKQKEVYRVSKKDLTARERALRFLGTYDQGKYYGMLRQMAVRQYKGSRKGESGVRAVIGKARLEARGLSLDFMTAEEVMPETVEGMLNARRTTSRAISAGNIFAGKEGLKDVSFITASEEFVKGFGQQGLMSSYVGTMNEMLRRGDLTVGYVEKELRDVFGAVEVYDKEGKIVSLKDSDDILQKVQKLQSGKFVAPIASSDEAAKKAGVYDSDYAFENLRKKLKQMSGGTEQERRLYNVITEGEDITSKLSAEGVKSVRRFWMFYGMRTDFMEDINLLKPIRMTLNKMATLSTAAVQLGYGVGEDPLFKVFTNLSNPWRQGHIKLSAKYGQITLGKDHYLRKFAESLVTPEAIGTLDSSKVVTFREGSFYYTPKGGSEMKLKDLPPDMSQFKYKAGGVPVKDLQGTILDTNLLKSDMMYIDLGKNVKANLLGGIAGQAKDYRYLPLPIGMMRLQGKEGNLILSTKDPAYDIISDIVDLQEKKQFDPTKPIRYDKLIESMIGNKGLLSKKADIMVSFGGRARLAPMAQHKMNVQEMVSAEKFYEATITESDFEDMIQRKERLSSQAGAKGRKATIHDQVIKATREAVAKKGEFMMALGVDPMQRQEHMSLMKVKVVKDSELKRNFFQKAMRRIGQLNIALHPNVLRAVERDLDRDVINFVLMEGTEIEGKTAVETTKLLQERYERQLKISKEFSVFQQVQAATTKGKPIAGRFAKLLNNDAFKSVAQMLGIYTGTLKSLGYSITRGSEAVMGQLIDKGAQAAEQLGLKGQGFSDEMIQSAIAPYIDAAGVGNRRLAVARGLLQNVYQGAVQKGTGKESLITLAEDITNIAQEFKGRAFNQPESINRATKAFEKFLLSEDYVKAVESGDSSAIAKALNELDYTSKNRVFQGLDYIADTEMQGITRPQIEALKTDLAANNAIINGEINESLIAKHKDLFLRINKAQSQILGEFMGIAAPLMGSVKSSFAGLMGVVQRQVIKPGDEPGAASTAFKGNAERVLGGALDQPIGLTPGGDIPFEETIAGDIGATAKKAKKELPKAAKFEKVKDYLKTGKGKLALGIGIGALGMATINSLFSGPQPPPMPRDVDARQPDDYGPEVIVNQPRVYGNNQVFAASRRRSPETFSEVPRYNFGVGNESRMTFRDKRSPTNPYLLEQQMRRVGNSDFNY